MFAVCIDDSIPSGVCCWIVGDSQIALLSVSSSIAGWSPFSSLLIVVCDTYKGRSAHPNDYWLIYANATVFILSGTAIIATSYYYCSSGYGMGYTVYRNWLSGNPGYPCDRSACDRSACDCIEGNGSSYVFAGLMKLNCAVEGSLSPIVADLWVCSRGEVIYVGSW